MDNAAKAGVAMAQACLAQNSFVAQWPNGTPLKPSTDCYGINTVSCPGSAKCHILNNGIYRASFEVTYTLDAQGKMHNIVSRGILANTRKSDTSVASQDFRTMKVDVGVQAYDSSTAQVSTYAGTGAFGQADGPIASATFANLGRITIDSSSNIYVIDGYKVRKISAAGVVSTLAGSSEGYVNATGTSARFSTMNGIGVDSTGNVFISDRDNHAIRKITPTGVVTTLAGSPVAYDPGYVNGTGTAARFDSPYGMALDASNNIFVADSNNGAIRKITPSGVVTVFSGTGPPGGAGVGPAGSYQYPFDVDFDPSGNLFIADSYNNRVDKLTPAAVMTVYAGAYNRYGLIDGTSTYASFQSPCGVSVDSNSSVLVADGTTSRIHRD